MGGRERSESMRGGQCASVVRASGGVLEEAVAASVLTPGRADGEWLEDGDLFEAARAGGMGLRAVGEFACLGWENVAERGASGGGCSGSSPWGVSLPERPRRRAHTNGEVWRLYIQRLGR
jgi:hypothetical protein